MRTSTQLHLAYFADDFTGATDALETLTNAGLKTALFLDPPTADQLARHPGLQAVGVAGLTRALSPEAIECTLRPAFTALQALHPRHVHYKVCSTFDSSPEIGSIGRAIEVAREVFGEQVVPLLVAAPALGRYCVFGQLHARYGIGSAGPIYRLDRHPAISRHPVTPMTEANLRVHLGQQTQLIVGLVDILTVKRGPAAIREALLHEVGAGAAIVLLDALTEDQLADIGVVLDGLIAADQTLFTAGSSGVAYALTANCRTKSPDAIVTNGTGVGPLLVVSGSCSPVTTEQINWAMANGFAGLHFDPTAADYSAIQASAERALLAGQDVVIYTNHGEAKANVIAETLGTQLGELTQHLVGRSKLSRLVIAGGDTSSYAARALGIQSLEMFARLVPGAPWCRAHAPGSAIDGILINFKGGQVGPPDYFGLAAQCTS